MLHGRVRIIDALGQVEASVPLRRPVSGRIRALKYRTYRLFQASHATRQDREDPSHQLRLRAAVQEPARARAPARAAAPPWLGRCPLRRWPKPPLGRKASTKLVIGPRSNGRRSQGTLT
jgi:hypothetical protein